MASTINTKIQLRTDLKANWESVNPVLKLGEIAIVCFDNDYKDIKIGNGISSFNQLSYLYQNAISAESITGKDLHVKSIAQGYNVKATPTSLATGIFSYADGNFDVVHGIEAQAKAGDDYAFVFNGKNLPLDGQNFYVSHGEGTFNINPKDGLSGFYIGEYSAASILSNYFLSNEISNYYNKTEVIGLYVDLENKIISVDNKLSDYYKKTETSSSAEISTAIDTVNATIAAESAARIDSDTIINSKVDVLSNSLSDYYTKSETSSTTELNTKFNDIYTKSETSSANEISAAFDNKVKLGNFADDAYNLSSSDLSVVKIAADDYYKLVSEEKQNDNVVYVLCSDNINAHGQTIINVAEPELSTDAANKNYVDTSLSGRLLSTDLSFNYDSTTKYIHLKVFNSDIGTVNCADFIKDGMLSTVYLSGDILVLVFNTDAGKTPISVNLSSFVDNYDAKINYLSNAISVIGEDYLDSNDKLEIYNDLLSPDEVTLYKGPGNKDITLSVGTGGTLKTYTATLSDFYLSSETSSASEISDAIASLGGSIAAEAAARATEDEKLSSEISSLSNQLSDYYKTSETSSKYEISSALDSKIKIGNYADGSYDLSSSDLSVVKIAADDYYQLISEEKELSDVLYVVSSDNINAHSERVIYVGDPISADDAANKKYVDEQISAIPLSDYYTKTETSSSNEISIALRTEHEFVMSRITMTDWSD